MNNTERRINGKLLMFILLLVVTNIYAQTQSEHPKEKEYIKSHIANLPTDYPETKTYIKLCENENENCPLQGIVLFAEGYCKMLDEGSTRKEALESMGKFFIQPEAEALIDAGIVVLCPKHMDKIPTHKVTKE